MTESRCPWSGRPFKAVKRGPNVKKFADDAARAEAHKAARAFTEHLIAEGFLSWDALREWWHLRRKLVSPSNTTAGAPDSRDDG